MATVDDLKEQFENEDAAGQEKGVDTSPAAQTPAEHPIESDDEKKGKKNKNALSESGDTELAPRRESSFSLPEMMTGSAETVRTILPNRTPFYLGVVALIVIDVLDAPVIAAAALGYEALKAWRPEDDERAARR